MNIHSTFLKSLYKKLNILFVKNHVQITEDLKKLENETKLPEKYDQTLKQFINIKSDNIIEIEPADIVDAFLPLSNEKLMNIPEDHRHRPFIVAKVYKDYFIGYCGSSNKKNIHINSSFELTQEDYNVYKDGYIETIKSYHIPFSNIIKKLDHLVHKDILRFNSIIVDNNFRRLNPQIDYINNIEKDCLLYKNNHFYYVYQIRNERIYAHKLRTEESKQKIKYNGQFLYVLEHTKIYIQNPSTYVNLGKYQVIEKKKKRKHTQEQYHLRSKPGSIYLKDKIMYIYLYSIGKKDYVLVGDQDGYEPIIKKIKNLVHSIAVGQLDDEKIHFIFDDFKEDKILSCIVNERKICTYDIERRKPCI